MFSYKKQQKLLSSYRPFSEASEGYVFTGVCHSVTGMLYSGKQTDATVIESHSSFVSLSPIGWKWAGGTHPTGMHPCCNINLLPLPFGLLRNF